MSVWACTTLLLLLRALRLTAAQQLYVAAPNTLRLNSNETIAVAVEEHMTDPVLIVVQDHPGKEKKIYETSKILKPGEPELLKIHLKSENFPPSFLSSPGLPKYVSLTANFKNFKKELIIPITSQSGYTFIQTDKPIYTPKEKAVIRIIPLNEDSKPTDERFLLQIRNPKNNIVKEMYFNDENMEKNTPFVNHIYKFPKLPMLGEWSATVSYGHNLEQNTTVRFELEEYVLPTFTLELKTPDFILPNSERIEVEVKANYVYKKSVNGTVNFRLGVMNEHAMEAIFFADIPTKELENGVCRENVQVKDLKAHKGIGWFPEIEGSHLVVEAIVVDYATGNKEKVIDSKGRFAKSPFLISFKRCLEDFKPGHTSVFEADVTYIDGSPAAGIQTKIQAVADNKRNLFIAVSSARSDEEGKVAFHIPTENHHKSITITLEADDPKYNGSQVKGTFKQFAYQSPQNAYIALARSSQQKLKSGQKFGKDIHFHPNSILDIYYLVTARGKIVTMKKLSKGEYRSHRIEFRITYDMVPSFRVLLFAHYKNELIADSLKIEVEKECDPNVQVSVLPEFGETEPGSKGKIVVQGPEGTSVGLLAVDEAVYALSEKDTLTDVKVFNELASHDLGCGLGGGVTVNSVLGNAGITMGTRTFSPSKNLSCGERKRRKREVAVEKAKTYPERYMICCYIGMSQDIFKRNCQERTTVVQKYLDGRHPDCLKAFRECCDYAVENGVTWNKSFQRTRPQQDDLPEFVDKIFEEEVEKILTFRKDFKETWMFGNIIIGPGNKEEILAKLPHSITTWVIQAVAVSPTHGICVAKPQKLVSFKKIFLHLNLPYSVVQNEMVEIQATVFNYGNAQIFVLVYMYGVKDLCSGTVAGEKSEKKRLIVDGQSAASVTFPVIPLKAEDIVIKVVAMSSAGSDAVERILHVVPEGVTKEIDISIKLDPTNQQKRVHDEVKTKLYSDRIHKSRNFQVIVAKIPVPVGFVPGTESCTITAIGDMYGPAVQTSINNPDALLVKPSGCGEQNMMYLAPTLYAMRYLKATGKLKGESEAKGYEFIRQGYENELAFKKQDGSYAAFPHTPTSTWLTAFVIKVFCQASELIHIDDDVVCSGVKWLMQNQAPDGSFIEKNPVYHFDMMGGVKGQTLMTAFVLIALEECKCDEQKKLHLVKKNAISYLNGHLNEVNTPLAVAVVAYALSLGGSELKKAANDKLLRLAKYDEGTNRMYWDTKNSAQDIETAGYALLNQILFNDMTKSASIANFLNTQQLKSGSFKSTQDTVIALQAMSNYAIRAQLPSINLISNITVSNDRNFHKALVFNNDNAMVLQEVLIDKVGGAVIINTTGHGMGWLNMKLRYNLNVPVEDICKFDVKIDVIKEEEENNFTHGSVDVFETIPIQQGIERALEKEPSKSDVVGRSRLSARMSALFSSRVLPKQGKFIENSKLILNIAICARYLGNKDAEMSIVDVGIFSGFEPSEEDLKKLQNDDSHFIQKYEKSSRGVVFYLEKVPNAKDYCFSFRVLQQYIVGNIHSSVIKVYDYYNPDETCTKFYRPESNSSIISTVCDGGICKCAEGGCPAKDAISNTSSNQSSPKGHHLKNMPSENYNYAWKGKLNEPIRNDGGFLNITFRIEEVIKAGVEKEEDVKDQTRVLLARDYCQTANLTLDKTYLILGKDGQKYMDENGKSWYRYVLDKTSAIYTWPSE